MTKTLKSFIFFILVPLMAGSIPFLASHFSPDRNLVFSLTGLVKVDPITALQLEISNQGKFPEKNVQIILESRASWVPSDEAVERQLTVDTKGSVATTRNGDRLEIQIGDLRPNEAVTVGIASRYVFVSAYDSDQAPMGVSIQSVDRLAEYKAPPGFIERNFSLIKTILIALLIYFAFLAVLYWFFKPKSPPPQSQQTQDYAPHGEDQSNKNV